MTAGTGWYFRQSGITLRTFDGAEPVSWTWEQAAKALLDTSQGSLF
jgi:hypothetical protein